VAQIGATPSALPSGKSREASNGAYPMTWQEQYLKRFYDRDRGWLDGTTEFWRLCEREIAPGSRVLEIGAGPSNRTSRFLASIGCLDCVDEDPVVLSNDALGHKLILERGRIPMPNGSYDACVSNYVLEHLRNPREHLCEVRRVLKPGGAYIFRTPNRWHYVALVAQGTPHWVHQIMAFSRGARSLSHILPLQLPKGDHVGFERGWAYGSRLVLH
jgi:SAM-dependent methyltransferase